MQSTAVQAAEALTAIGERVAATETVSSSISAAVALRGEATDQIGSSVGIAIAASHRVNAATDEVDRATSLTGDAAAGMLTDIARLKDQVSNLNNEALEAITKIRAA